MSEYLPLIAKVREDRIVYVRSESYEALVAFFIGLNEGNEGGALLGFQQWIIVRANGPENYFWAELVLHLAFPQAEARHEDLSALAASSKQNQEIACAKLFDLFGEYFRDLHAQGYEPILQEHREWLQS